jgi:oligopeptide/dipeptide ABC transporter ATP-binding protein
MNQSPPSSSLNGDLNKHKKILEVQNLITTFQTDRGAVTAVHDVSFDVFKGKTLGIVGESGSGKSVTALSIMRLIPNPPGKIQSGSIKLHQQNLLQLQEEEMRKIRGHKISMIFQEPMTSLNPVFTVGNQIQEVLELHKHLSKKDSMEKAVHLLKLVGIPAPEKRIKEYPHQLSGGMRQRVMIAMALACEPELLIADEPTTALDVTIQAQILDLMNKLQEELGMGIILITHDLGVVAETCDDVAVMYCGRIVEKADVKTLFSQPRHPYTKGLIESIPSFDSTKTRERGKLYTIDGVVPSLLNLPPGCSFQNRCHQADETCKGKEGHPQLKAYTPLQQVSCFHPLP